MTTVGIDIARPGSDFTVYTIGGVSYRVGPRYYLASCDGCGWIGSSEDCGTDEADDVFCPRCHRSGADGGKVAMSADMISSPEGA